MDAGDAVAKGGRGRSWRRGGAGSGRRMMKSRQRCDGNYKTENVEGIPEGMRTSCWKGFDAQGGFLTSEWDV